MFAVWWKSEEAAVTTIKLTQKLRFAYKKATSAEDFFFHFFPVEIVSVSWSIMCIITTNTLNAFTIPYCYVADFVVNVCMLSAVSAAGA